MRKLLCAVLLVGLLSGCAYGKTLKGFEYAEYPLERNGIRLHLDCVSPAGPAPATHILLVHGVTYSSHEFDVDYKDYSLVRRLAGEGYGVWRLDIAGFGQSEEVKDGFMPDSDYAADDINAAVESIVKETGVNRIDVLGWSWGTVTAGRFAARYPEHLNRLVLYAPILGGVGEVEVKEPFHHNTWEHAADDFQRGADGNFDMDITEPMVIEMLCSSSWHYDRESSPNGGRRDICVAKSEKLIDLSGITVPTLVICGSKDPYLNYDMVNDSLKFLPKGSALEIINGGSHIVMYEAPYYRDFQNSLIRFLDSRPRSDRLFQVALLQSLMQGEYDGVVTVGELKEYGDTGIGTFQGVNGELIALDGTVYQALWDGSVEIAPDNETVPFSNVTFFDADIKAEHVNAEIGRAHV